MNRINEVFILNNSQRGYVTIDLVRGYRVRSYDIPYKHIERYCHLLMLLSKMGFRLTCMRALTDAPNLKTYAEYIRNQ